MRNYQGLCFLSQLPNMALPQSTTDSSYSDCQATPTPYAPSFNGSHHNVSDGSTIGGPEQRVPQAFPKASPVSHPSWRICSQIVLMELYPGSTLADSVKMGKSRSVMCDGQSGNLLPAEVVCLGRLKSLFTSVPLVNDL
jgi:hypothetical protein